MNWKSQSTGIVYAFGEALAVFDKIAAHASGLNHVMNKGQTSRTEQNRKTFSSSQVNHLSHTQRDH